MRKSTCLAVLLGLTLNLGLRAETNAVFKCQVGVVDAQGQPLSGVVVENFEFEEWSSAAPLAPKGRQTTDRTGTVSLTTTNQGYGVILARKTGLALTWGGWYPGQFTDPDDVVVELKLLTPKSVTGVVRDAGDKPVGGALVWAKTAVRTTQVPLIVLPTQLARREFSAHTGADGKFRIDGLPQDARIDLTVTKPGLALDRPRESSGFLDFFSAETEVGESNLVLVLKPAGAIEGRVVKAEGGAPVPGARVTLAANGVLDTEVSPAVIADASGGFRFADLERGEYQLLAQLGTNSVPELIAEPAAVTVETGVTNREAKLSLGPGGLLEVTVKDATDEKPIAGAMVSVTSPGSARSTKPVTTSAQGIALLRLPPGDYTVFASKGRTIRSGSQASVALNQTNQAALSFAAPEPTVTLSGTVLDPAGQPVPKATVLLFPYSLGEKKTDARGRFELKSNPNQFGGGANFQRVVIARDLVRNLAAAVDVDEEVTNATVQLKPGLTLVGHITTLDGKPITNAQATIQLWGGQMAAQIDTPAKADGRGVLEIKGLPRGRRYGLTVSARGFGQDTRTIEETDTDTNRLELEGIQLAPANLRLAGVVLDPDDKPVPGAFVNGFGEKQPQVNGRADAKGRFTFDHVCAGPINLSANDPRRGQFGNVSAEGGDTNITIRLGSQQANFGGGNAASQPKVSGTVLDPDGKPAAKVAVSLFPDFSNLPKKTDEAGHFVLASNPNQFGSDNRRVLIARDLDRNLAAAIDLDNDATNADLKLEPGLTLAGQVSGPDGKPIANAEATLTLWATSMGTSYGSPARADAQGRFEIKALPPGRHYGVSVAAKGFGQDNKDLAANVTGVTRLELDPFQLALANLRIAGVVLDADDKPVARAFVNTFGGEKQPQLNCRADAKGHFSFDHVCAGAINLSANSQNGGENGTVSAEGGDTNITIHLGSQEANFGGGNARPRQKIRGEVLDADGKPAAKVVINGLPDFSSTQRKTDEAGRFNVVFDPNRFGGGNNFPRVIIARDLGRNLAAAVEVEEDATNATLRLAPGFTLAGQALDVNGKPLTNAEAQLMFRTPRMSSSLGQAVRADAAGKFEIKALPAGREFSVMVSANGYGRDSHNTETGEGGNRRVELEAFQLLVADQRIAGVVLDPDDKPVAGAWVSCYGDKQNGQSGQTDSKGRFAFDKLCQGSLQLSANNQSGGFANTEAQAGDTNITLHLGSSAGRRASAPRPAGLRGKPLPDLVAAGLTPNDAPADQAVLALLIDAEERPCRRALRALGEQAASLKQKGVAVVVLQSGEMAEDAFTAWKQEAATPFPVARLKQEPEKARAAWGAGELPWLILTDKAHKVIAEGFGVDDLDAKLGEIK